MTEGDSFILTIIVGKNVLVNHVYHKLLLNVKCVSKVLTKARLVSKGTEFENKTKGTHPTIVDTPVFLEH